MFELRCRSHCFHHSTENVNGILLFFCKLEVKWRRKGTQEYDRAQQAKERIVQFSPNKFGPITSWPDFYSVRPIRIWRNSAVCKWRKVKRQYYSNESNDSILCGIIVRWRYCTFHMVQCAWHNQQISFELLNYQLTVGSCFAENTFIVFDTLWKFDYSE